MSVKIEVKGKTWPEKYQKILDRTDELVDDSAIGQACVWGLIGSLASARANEIEGRKVGHVLATLSLAVEAFLQAESQEEGRQEAEKPEQDAEKTQDPGAAPEEGIDSEAMLRVRDKAGEAGRCLDELKDAEAEWCALMPKLVNSDYEKEAWTRLVTADERMRRTRSQLRRLAKIAMGYIKE